ncbi:MAG: TonB-dependent receptor plug domain-containing protein [Phormidesmis sp.]
MNLGMMENWIRLGIWPVRLMAGLWLMMGQVAIANENERVLMKAPVAAALTAPETINLTAPASEPVSEVSEWLTQAEPVEVPIEVPVELPVELAEITNIRLEETTEGFVLRLETTGELAAPTTSITGNAAIADISNATLQLPSGEGFSASTPTEGIAFIDVTSRSDNQIRIAITGTNAPPNLSVEADAIGLVVSVVASDRTVQIPSDDSIQIVVTGEQSQDDYFVPEASSATRTDTPILETPASIQVIPRQVLEDQQAIDLGDALANVSGASVNSTEGRGFQINLRGFDGAALYRDGFRLYSPNDNGDAAGQGFPEIANVERIEVLRGPASVLFGQSEPGGAVNIVSKRPLDKPFYNVGIQVGSSGLVRPQIDISGGFVA